MVNKVFIDGSAGTTGLRIGQRLAARSDLELVIVPDELRKDPAARAEAMNSADVVFLCLPDAAALEAVDFVTNPNTVVVDTSTAHRTNPEWTFGFAELSGQREKLAGATRIANPGCHSTGFIALVAPLVDAGVLAPEAALTCFSITGYSGGGKKMIADYDDPANAESLLAPRTYGLGQDHKHLPEMMRYTGLTTAPMFTPIVSSYIAGMQVSVPVFASQLSVGASEITGIFEKYYSTGLVHVNNHMDEAGFISSSRLAGRDDLEIGVFGNEERINLVATFDNLGKGASGAAIQNMNIALGVDEAEGLNTGGLNTGALNTGADEKDNA